MPDPKSWLPPAFPRAASIDTTLRFPYHRERSRSEDRCRQSQKSFEYFGSSSRASIHNPQTAPGHPHHIRGRPAHIRNNARCPRRRGKPDSHRRCRGRGGNKPGGIGQNPRAARSGRSPAHAVPQLDVGPGPLRPGRILVEPPAGQRPAHPALPVNPPVVRNGPAAVMDHRHPCRHIVGGQARHPS